MRVSPVILAFALVSTACGRLTDDNRARPAEPSEPAVRASIAAGGQISCAIVADGRIACWGDRRYVGAGFTQGDAAIGISPPVAVSFPEGERFDQVVVSTDRYALTHACALGVDGRAWCWGDDSQGALGDGGMYLGTVPSEVKMPDGTSFTQIGAGYSHTCALDESGRVWCWGSRSNGQLGDDGSWYGDPYGVDGAMSPAQVPLPAEVLATDMAVGSEHTCALATSGEVWCWGDDVSYDPPPGPVRIPAPPGAAISDLVAGREHTCALTEDGTAWCWYFNWGRKKSNGFAVNEPEPVSMPEGVSFERIVSGSTHICGISTQGQVWCWASWESDRIPTRVEGALASGATDVAVGDGHACAITGDSTAWCWGDNEYGQLGDGTRDASSVPVPVAIDLSAAPPAPIPSAPLSIVPIELEPYAGDAFLSAPPIWSLDMGETRRIWSARDGIGEIPESWGFPEECRNSESGGLLEDCVLAYLASLGASDRALSLLRDRQVTVSRVAGTFPVWVTESYDWSTFGTNYDGATPNLIFTPNGIIDLSGLAHTNEDALYAEFGAALESDLDERIAAASEDVWGPAYGEIFLGPYAEDFEVPFAAPSPSATGWSIPFSARSGSGFHCCSYQFIARFVLDLDREGAVTGVRFIDWCYDPRETFSDGSEPPADALRRLAEIGADLPLCSTS